MTYIKLAWRNLWRNKKRTLIAAASVFFAVILALVTRSMQKGSYNYMIHASASMFTGYIQVHGKNYWDKKSLEQSMVVSDSVQNEIRNIPEITNVVPRLESFTLVSHKNYTKVSQIIGIDPIRESKMTHLSGKIVSGHYLDSTSEGALIAQGLADLLKVSVGDSIVIYGQGYHGVTAAARIPVLGILKFNLPELNKATTYLSLNYAQWLFSAPGRITSLSIMLKNPDQIDEVYKKIDAQFDNNYEVMTWAEMLPDLVQSIESDNAGGIIMLGILYIVIGFGIFGTIMMMTTERSREFGILISVGMKKWKLIFMTTIETFLISIIGVVLGVIGSVPILIYFYHNPIHLTGNAAQAMLSFGFEPILPFAIYPGMFIAQGWTVLAIALCSALYPLTYIKKLKAVKALHD
jgi:ABC-type lipoprotein release transport system permease subunit